jgi:anaerobic magnesium-protoporphyrin IX monomethyl ester cyclase
MSVQFREALDLADKVRNVSPGTAIVFGGVHTTSRPQDAPAGSIVVRGPGEESMLRIIRDELAPPSSPLQGTPCAYGDFNPLPDEATMNALTLAPEDATFSLMTSRGCPFSCKFCLNPEQRETKVSEYPLDDVFALIEAALRYGYRKFFISDDVFFLKKDRVLEFCERIRMYDQRPALRAFTHARVTDGEMYRAAAEAGFRNLALGVESGNDAILKRIGKNITVTQIEECVRAIANAGIRVNCLYMVGNPGETRETVGDTIRLAGKLHRLYGATSWFSIAQPFPGTAFREEAPSCGTILHNDFEHYDNTRVSFVPDGMSREEIPQLVCKGMIYGNRGPLTAPLRHAVFRLSGR